VRVTQKQHQRASGVVVLIIPNGIISGFLALFYVALARNKLLKFVLQLLNSNRFFVISGGTARQNYSSFQFKEKRMKLTPPKSITFWIGVVLGLLGLLGGIGVIGAVAGYAFWLAFAGFAVLALGLLVKGM
jgi:hypothetical protein